MVLVLFDLVRFAWSYVLGFKYLFWEVFVLLRVYPADGTLSFDADHWGVILRLYLICGVLFKCTFLSWLLLDPLGWFCLMFHCLWQKFVIHTLMI